MTEDKQELQLQFHRSSERIVNDYNSMLQHFQSHLTRSPALHRFPKKNNAFIGRQAEIQQVMAWKPSLASGQVEGAKKESMSIAIAGQAGVGKSALAVHIADLIKQDFNTQLYVDLHGSENQPIASTDVLAGFLRAWGVSDSAMPEDLAERSRLFNSLIAEKRTLILLDNAFDEAQVRPLIPTGSACIVLITSRKRLTELQDVQILDLTEMPDSEAWDLFKQLVGVSAFQSETEANIRAIDLCGRLPLCIGLAAGVLRQQPQLPIREYVDQLTDADKRLKHLHLSYPEVRAIFALSYQGLKPTAARLLRATGLLADPTFHPTTAAVLLECKLEIVMEAINQLVGLRLVEPIDQERYYVHDLVRLLSRGQLAAEDPAEARQQARLRLGQHYLEICKLMNLGLDPSARLQLALAAKKRGKQSVSVLEQSLFWGALNWFEAERLNLVAAVDWAYQSEAWEMTLLLAENLITFFDIRTYWIDWEQTHLLALEAAHQLGDRSRVAQVLNNLGNVYLRQSNWDKASARYNQSLELSHELKIPELEAQTLMNLGILYAVQNQVEKAFSFWNSALTKISSNTLDALTIRAWMQASEPLLLQRVEAYFSDRPNTEGIFQVIGKIVKKLIPE
jgi:hypothetical protein